VEAGRARIVEQPDDLPGWYPATGIAHMNGRHTPTGSHLDSDFIPGFGVAHGVFNQRIKGGGKPGAVGDNGLIVVYEDLPIPSGRRAPSPGHIDHD
jgi:hypothetical protein